MAAADDDTVELARILRAKGAETVHIVTCSLSRKARGPAVPCVAAGH